MFSGGLLSPYYAINRNVINSCPPQFDHLEGGEFKEYDFKWTPEIDDRGTGALRIALPFAFSELPLQRISILENQIYGWNSTLIKPSK